jgi:hypothetical protein
MRLVDLLRARGPEVLARWRTKILEVYDRGFAGRTPDRFANPVGAAVRDGAEAVWEGLLAGEGAEELRKRIDGIVRVRSVQELDADRALAFVFQLRPILREVVRDCGAGEELAAELADFETRLDVLALAAFTAYAGCREEIWELKYRMMRDRSYKLMERAGFLWEEDGAGSPCDRGEHS